jgi:CxxC motif-containing protein
MDTKTITCIECPVGCSLQVDIENCKVVKVSGHKCPKGEKYAITEVENPVRILTSTVLTKGLPVKMVPVRTDGPIPKARIMDIMSEIRKMVLDRPVRVGDVVAGNILGSGVNLVATRDIESGD